MSANPAAAFLASMARPDAAKVSAAVAEVDPDTGARSISDAIDDVRSEALAAQRPPRTPPPGGVDPELYETSSTPDDLGFSDDEPIESTPRPLADHVDVPAVDPALIAWRPEPESEPDPEPEPAPAAWERHAAQQQQPEPEYLPPPPEPEPEPAPAGPTLRGRLRDIGGRPLRIAVIAAGAVLLVVAIVASFMVTGRGRPPEPAVQVAPPPAANDVPPPTAKEAVLIPAQVSASCGNDSDAVAPFSGDRTRAWVCMRINGLDLNVLNISFACPVVITSITVVPGWNFVAPDGRDEWVRHRLVASISWRLGGAVYPQAPIVPTRTGVTMKVPNVITQEMSATITSSMRPPMGESKSDDFGSKADESAKVDEFTAIGSIKIMGHPVDPGSGLCGGTTTK